MSIKVNSLSGKEWLQAMKSSRDFLDSFALEYSVTINLVKYIEEECGGWKRYIRRFQWYGKSKDYVRELWHDGGLGRDKIYDFVSKHEGALNGWLRFDSDEYILKLIKHYNLDVIDIKDCWLKKNSDMFIHLCCDFIGSLTSKLLNFMEINEL